MWHPIIASRKTYEHKRDALVELKEALYQANLNYITGEEDVKRIGLAIEILKGKRDDLLK